jgi:hypothetical protein
MGQLLAHQDQDPVFAQVYIHDQEEQLRLRVNGSADLKAETIGFWNGVMVENPFALRFRQIGLENCREKQYVIKERIGDDSRRYFNNLILGIMLPLLMKLLFLCLAMGRKKPISEMSY